jgi:DNA-binding MarR family transcriptional regulator
MFTSWAGDAARSRTMVSVPGVGDDERSERARQAERLVLQMASFGSEATAAMTRATGLPDLVTNAPLLVLCLLDLDGPARPSVIADVVGLTTGGTTKLLDRMEGAGLVKRAYGVIENDHRGVEVALTEEGRQMLRSASGALVDHLADATALVKSIVSLLDELAPG